MRRAGATILLALAAAACAPEERPDPLPPLDRFYYPIGLATTRLGGGTALFVASSNFDLRYAATDGGTLLSMDAAGGAAPGPVVPLGAERIGSYAGSVAVADAVTCPGIASPIAMVASRYDDVLYRFGIDGAGALSCGDGCAVAPGGPPRDPFAVTPACLPAGAPTRPSGLRRAAYVGWLFAPKSTRGAGYGAWITEVDLDRPLAGVRNVEIGDGPVRSLAYEPASDRLWIATQSSGARALLYSVVLSDPRWTGSAPWEAASAVDLFPAVRGAELRAVAVGTPPAAGVQRLYATARLYDAETQDSTGTRPGGDVGGVLLVLDVTAGVDGLPVVQVRRIVSIGTGVGDVAVVRRAAPARDLVVATVLDGDLVLVYDDAAEAVALEIAHTAQGVPILGDRPVALAIDQPVAGGPATVFVAAFGSGLVTRFGLDPANPAADPTASLRYFGGLAP